MATDQNDRLLARILGELGEQNELLRSILGRLPDPADFDLDTIDLDAVDLEPGEVRQVELREPAAPVHEVDEVDEVPEPPVAGGNVDEEEDEPAEDVEPQPADPARPPVRASKAAWVAYAIERGTDEAEAEAMTKAALIEAYGDE